MESKLTPMMRQYLDIKKEHPDDILFFRLGDFYEMFFEDATAASKILDIALTSRQNDVPMCGVPYHAAESYIARLIKAGKRVAICEQMEAVPSSGTVVKREVVRIITPGTVVEQNLLGGDENSYLCSAVVGKDDIGLAFVDVSTGDFYLTSIDKSLELFRGEITRFSPREVVYREGPAPEDARYTEYLKNIDAPLYALAEWHYDAGYLAGVIQDAFGLAGVKGLGIGEGAELLAAGSILQYLRDTQRKSLGHLKHPRRVAAADFMSLDDATIRNLELVRNQQDGGKQRTLFSALNRTSTAMGRRALERNILQPLTARGEIERRLDIVQYFFEYHALAGQVRSALEGVLDMERVLSRLAVGRAYPRDYLALRDSIGAAARARELLEAQPLEEVRRLAREIPPLEKLAERIGSTIIDEPALTPEHGRVIRPGRSAEIDRLHDLKKDAKAWVLEFEERQKKALGIPTLKVKYNRVFGYYIEVSRGQSAKVPDGYMRKQTLKGAERYTTDELQKFEEEVLTATDTIVSLEKKELDSLLQDTLAESAAIQRCAAALGDIDFLCSLAAAAVENRYVRPRFNDDGVMSVQEGRHPIVERYYTKEIFIPNDIRLDGNENIIKIITGPNMSGKSTYIRTAAVIQLMAQTGSFVPAREADLPLADRIFTRIGASDNISRGESTFLVEMTEAAVILNNATPRSLIVMDEVGRGTSTYDGVAIAWAVVEYIARYIRARTLFATHYHELTELGGSGGVVNYTVMVKEKLDGVEFLHKVVPGSADRSYGIHVAKLAGVPKEITSKAEKIQERLEKRTRSRAAAGREERDDGGQLDIFNAANHRVVKAISEINLDAITPLEALNELARLKKAIE